MIIHIEYCVKWNYGPEFDRVSKIINKFYPGFKVSGNDYTPRSGAFEVTIDNQIVFSKFKTGDFPSDSEIKKLFK